MLSGYALDKEIRIGGYGNEEGGLRGSAAYVASLPTEERARFIGSWVMDMVATPYERPASGRIRWMVSRTTSSSRPTMPKHASGPWVSRIAGSPGATTSHSTSRRHHAVFSWMYYRPNVNGCLFNGSYRLEPQYHRPDDTMDNISPDRLQVMLNLVGSSVFHGRA